MRIAMLNNKGLTPLEKTIDKVGGRYTTNADRGLMSPSAYLVGENSVTGLTLIEVLIAALITLILFFALMQSALLSIEMNAKNLLRDEAVRIAEERTSDARDEPFDTLADDPVPIVCPVAGFPFANGVLIPRELRNITLNYCTNRTVTALGSDNKQVEIRVDLDWKGEAYKHSILTIVGRL